jgi:hypothetical protein
MSTRLKIKGGLQTRAAFAPDTFDAEKGTVDLVWTTGARGKRYSWDGPYYEELEVSEKAVDLARLNNGASVLNAHGSWSLSDVIGVVERAWIANGEGRATVRFSDREDVKPIRADVQNGIIRHVSVGYSVGKYEKVEETDGVPVMRATRWTPAEISLVPIAFDDGAAVRSAAESESYEVEIVSRGADAPAEERAMPEKPEVKPAEPVVIPQPENTEAIRAEAVKAERERATLIRQAVRAAKLEDKIAEEFIAKDAKIEEVRAAVLAQLAAKADAIPTENHVRVEAGEDASEKFQRGAMAWLLRKASVSGNIERAKKVAPEHFKEVESDPGEFRGMSLVDLARESLERVGVKTRGMDKPTLIGNALTRSTHGFNTTSDFASLLENTLHKTLLASYATTPDTWAMFSARGSVTDFRPHPRYRLGSFGRLDTLNEHSEFQQKSIPDAEKQSITATTKGNVIALSRQAIINDDMSAFTRLATMLGRGAKLSIEMDVYDALALNAGMGPLLSDGKALFHVDHKNINATGSVLSTAGVYADRVVMASQKDPSGNEILDLRPHCLCVPVGLGGDARVINEAQYDPDTANKLQRPNVSRGMFSVLCDTPRLSGTRRYIFADPNVAPVFEVAFLDGQSEPYLETMHGWRVDGVEWKVRLDYGVGAVDFRGAVTNAGI